MIYDTCFIIDFLKGRDEAVRLFTTIKDEPYCVSSITIFELAFGYSSDIDEISNHFLSLDVNPSIAKKAGEIAKELKEKGTPIESEDCFIAATALCENQILVTRNKKHFERIKDLEVLSY